MESVEAKVRYVIFTKVVRTEEKFRSVHVSGYGNDTVIKHETMGWFVYLQGSYEALHLGRDKPEFAHGDTVKITFEKVTDAKPV